MRAITGFGLTTTYAGIRPAQVTNPMPNTSARLSNALFIAARLAE